jgi:hypothetical protein
MAKPFKHDWAFMANGGSNRRGELAQCQVNSCRMWQFSDGTKAFKMSHDKFVEMHNRGEIDASEVLGKPVTL